MIKESFRGRSDAQKHVSSILQLLLSQWKLMGVSASQSPALVLGVWRRQGLEC